MTTIIFETPGLIDIRAFTTLGLSAKPNSANPIGYFGTGLKYSVATLLRLGASVVVFIGKDRYEFFVEKDSFRGADYQKIRMRCRKWGGLRATNIDLPFALSYGRNWSPWQAYRELESNTRDENGSTFVFTPETDGDEFENASSNTAIIVTHPLFFEAYEKRDEVFLPGARSEGQGVDATEDGPKNRFYWRGLRVLDLDRPAIFTYNVLDMKTLTEDRTLPEWDARNAIAHWLLKSANEAQIEAVLTCDEESWEHEMNFPSWVMPSDAFRAVIKRCRKDVFPTAISYYGAYAEPAPKKRQTINPWVAWPLPWEVSEYGEVLTSDGTILFEKPSNFDDEEWKLLAEAMTKRIARTKVEPSRSS